MVCRTKRRGSQTDQKGESDMIGGIGDVKAVGLSEGHFTILNY